MTPCEIPFPKHGFSHIFSFDIVGIHDHVCRTSDASESSNDSNRS